VRVDSGEDNETNHTSQKMLVDCHLEQACQVGKISRSRILAYWGIKE
jgi:hypothetical protein